MNNISKGTLKLRPLWTSLGLFYINNIHTNIDTMADIGNVPMMRNGNRMMNTGRMVKIADQSGNAAVPDMIAMINVKMNTRYPT